MIQVCNRTFIHSKNSFFSKSVACLPLGAGDMQVWGKGGSWRGGGGGRRTGKIEIRHVALIMLVSFLFSLHSWQ